MHEQYTCIYIYIYIYTHTYIYIYTHPCVLAGGLGDACVYVKHTKMLFVEQKEQQQVAVADNNQHN